jgi:hypothetical protein
VKLFDLVGLENSPATFVANIEDNATIAGVLVPPQPAPPRGGGFGGAAYSPAYLIKGRVRRGITLDLSFFHSFTPS